MKPKIKFCGITREEDLRAGVAMEADYLGFIFYEKSARFLSLEKAERLISKNDFKKTLKVGVFVDQDLKQIIRMQKRLSLDVIQLHGEKKINLEQYKKALPVKEIWPVVRPKDTNTTNTDAANTNIANVAQREHLQMKREKHAFFLLDKYDAQLKGGVGKSIEWDVLKPYLRLNKKIILAGGIDLEKIFSLVKAFKKEKNPNWELPYAFDCNSKVEIKPGIKDHKKMLEIKNFLNNLN